MEQLLLSGADIKSTGTVMGRTMQLSYTYIYTQYTHIINDWYHRVHLHEIEIENEIVRSNVNAEVALMLLAHGWRE